MRWRQNYVKKFQVRTLGNRRVSGSDCGSIEEAERVASQGRERFIWKWVDGRYLCVKSISL